MQIKIWQVVDVGIKILRSGKSPKEALFIIASGVVTSGGWSNPILIPYYYFTAPEDGIYNFDFVADSPTGSTIQVITPVITTFIWENLPDGVKGVRVYGSTGEPKVKMLEELSSMIPSSDETYSLVWHRPGF
ncbi:hypothetical protein [Pseudanabaena sp. PCC 6802]|uniref:hypothetical protein n=1 Tax=Pseudanabaena sp. PCC 6802 TaxID=118173 RepID=UPI0003750514|nr:hypothetical protein [Pseudanabaena sp. PCC 6802]